MPDLKTKTKKNNSPHNFDTQQIELSLSSCVFACVWTWCDVSKSLLHSSVDLKGLLVAVVKTLLVSPGVRYTAHLHLVESVPLVDESSLLTQTAEPG